jgi:hypothetical protein
MFEPFNVGDQVNQETLDTLMQIKCGWCKRDMGTKQGQGETTSICPTCTKLLMASLRLAEVQTGGHHTS